LEIRVLTQLSSVAYNSGEYDKAKEFANEAIQKARDNQLMIWAADGLVRLASAELKEANYTGADRELKEAKDILNETQQDRVQADANLTLASLRNQQHRSADVLAPAKAAAAYYKANGYVGEAVQATILIGRAQRDQGDWHEVLQTADDLLTLAKRFNRNNLLVQAEELKGSVYLDMEDYPDALAHDQTAFLSAQDKVLKQYEAMHCADVLWRLGRFAEAQTMLESAPAISSTGEVEVEFLLVQLKHGAAARKALELIGKFPDMPATRLRDLHLDIAIAEVALGKAETARHHLENLLAPDGQPATENGQSLAADDLAAFELAAARIYLTVGDAKTAFDEATKAESYFESQHLLDSELRSSLLLTQAAKSLHDAASYKSFSKKVVDIQTELSNTWPSPDFHSYISRPDLKFQLKGIAN
jgi:tetratricopeptide (TPR) repeat protein